MLLCSFIGNMIAMRLTLFASVGLSERETTAPGRSFRKLFENRIQRKGK